MFGTGHQPQMRGFFWDLERGPNNDLVQLSSDCGHEAGGCEWLALSSESLCFSGIFSVGLSSLMPSIITVQMIIFPAPLPNSCKSLAFPLPTKKWPGSRLNISLAFQLFFWCSL